MTKKQKEYKELALLINQYMFDKQWTVSEALNFIKDVLLETARKWGVKKDIFVKQCDLMKEDFDDVKPLYMKGKE